MSCVEERERECARERERERGIDRERERERERRFDLTYLSCPLDIISLDCHYACRILVKMTKSAQLLCPHSSSANQALENHKLRRIASQLCLGRDTPESLVPSCNVPSRTPRSGVSFLVVSLSLALYRSLSLSLSRRTCINSSRYRQARI